MRKSVLTTAALAFAVGLSGAMLTASTTDAQAQAKPKAAKKAVNYEAMKKDCQAATKGIYTADQRVFTYGYCVSKMPYAGNQQAQVVGR